MTQENLRDTDALWDAINQHSIVSMADPAGNITFVNDTFVRISGYSREELMGQNHRILKSDVQGPEFWDAMWKTISSGYVWKGTVCNRAKDGSSYWVEAQISPFFDATGAIEKYVSIRTDITAHKRALDELEIARSLKAATEALQLRKFYMRATLDNLPFQFWLKDLQGHYLATNQVLADACGFSSADDVTGLTDLELWPTALALNYQSIDAQVIDSRQAQTREERAGADGGGRWLEIFIKPLIAGNGAMLGTVGYSHDISERKLAQKQLQQHTDHLHAIFGLSPDGFVSFDAGQRVSHVSPAFTRMTGIDPAQLNGIDEQAFSRLLECLCSADCRFQGFESLRQPAAPHKSGQRNLIELSLGGKRMLEITLRTGDSGMVSQILYFRDVTIETEVERLKNEFLSTAAHELRTPMVSIYGYAELLLSREFDEASRREYLGVMFVQSKVMVSILNDLLDLARIDERRGQNFEFAAVDVVTLLSATKNSFKPPIGRTAPELMLPPVPCAVLVDSKQATQAIANVLANAYKYSPAGGAVKISVVPPASACDTPLLGICITDHGIGMTPEQLNHVFERFYRADNSGKVLGTGLGMSIVHEIVTLHGGRVELISQPAVGTSVTLWLPALQGQDATALNIDN
jgi:PAS domain S-box-containing protein